MTRLIYGLAGVAAAITVAAPAEAQRRKEITPYIEIGQVLDADLKNGDVLTYSTISAGIDATVQTKRVEVQISYKYERRISYDEDIGDDDVHSGLARAAVAVAPGFSIEGGALATRARSDIRGAAPGELTGNLTNIAQVYSAYVGPTIEKQVGPASLSAGYRFGYTKVESTDVGGFGGPPLDSYDDARSHLATASIGVESGRVLPFGFTLSGAWQREDAGQLEQRYNGYYGRGDIVLPLFRGLAVVGGAGYEKIRVTQRDALLDAGGDPVVDSNGRFVTDPNGARRTAFETDGLYWDAGILWRPSQRTTIEARVGRRYDSWTYTGSLSWQVGPGAGLQIGVYDSVQSFGRQLNGAVAALPTSFSNTGDPFSDNYNGCVFGTTGAAPGGCLTNVFQSIATANYRARGVDGVMSFQRGSTKFGFGAGYANRRFYAPDLAPGFTVDGLSDQSYYAQVFAARALDSRSGISGNLYANYFISGIAGSEDVYGAGANGQYYRSFGRLSASLSGGVYTFGQEQSDSEWSAQALLGLGYRF